MLKAAVLSVALLFAVGSAMPAHSATSGKHSKYSHSKHRHAGGGGHLQGEAACSADAKRLCRSEIPGGDMAVLACFKTKATRLSGGCRTLLQSYGQI